MHVHIFIQIPDAFNKCGVFANCMYMHVLLTKKKICEEAINGDMWNLEYLDRPTTTP